jgi:hypothetical protein
LIQRITVNNWVIVLWITINYFLTVVYLIITVAIIIEWLRKPRNSDYDDLLSNDILVHFDVERQLYGQDEPISDFMFLNSKEIKRLRTTFVMNKTETIKLKGLTCSICFDSLDNYKKKVIRLPRCEHLFHWK